MRPDLRLLTMDEERASTIDAAPLTFDAFVQEEGPALFRRMCIVTGNRHEAEEIVQDAFVAVFERWDRVGVMDDPAGYLVRTAFNTFRKRWRRAMLAVRKTAGLMPGVDEFADADDRHVVRKALGALTPRQRAAVVLTEMLGYTSEEAGEILGVRPVTIRTLAMHGRAALRAHLEADDG